MSLENRLIVLEDTLLAELEKEEIDVYTLKSQVLTFARLLLDDPRVVGDLRGAIEEMISNLVGPIRAAFIEKYQTVCVRAASYLIGVFAVLRNNL